MSKRYVYEREVQKMRNGRPVIMVERSERRSSPVRMFVGILAIFAVAFIIALGKTVATMDAPLIPQNPKPPACLETLQDCSGQR